MLQPKKVDKDPIIENLRERIGDLEDDTSNSREEICRGDHYHTYATGYGGVDKPKPVCNSSPIMQDAIRMAKERESQL
jgi:hypothetical protein